MSILDQFAGTRVLIIGDVMLDRYWWGSVGRISPEAPVPVVKLEKTSLAAGGAANVATNVAGLTAEPILLGVVGCDHEAEAVRRLLSESGVSPDFLIGVEGRPTTVKTRIIAHSQQVVRIDQELENQIDSEAEARIIRTLDKILPSIGAVVISDYAKGLLTADLLRLVLEKAATNGKPVLVDPKGKDYSKYSGATLITPNRREAAEACNLAENSADLVENAGIRLLTEVSVESVLITQGEEGMTLFRRGSESRHFPAAAREVYDVTGAGDTVIAALATAKAAGADLETATWIANAAAGYVVEQIGTTAITLEDVRSSLNGTESS